MKTILIVLIFLLLTIITQIGGVIFLLSLLCHKFFNRLTGKRAYQRILKVGSFLAIYLLTTIFIVPFIAKPFGRVALPLKATDNLQPLNIVTCLLNRNYVKEELSKTAYEVARQMNERFPGTKLNYLDANFPFMNKFPLFPHLSHNDGKKLDLAFCYTDNKNDQQTNECPSLIGYGICEEPAIGEDNTAAFCEEQGYWQYSVMKKIMPQGNDIDYTFDGRRTRALVNFFADQKTIGKIFIEPHLQARLNLKSEKIRFHGCQAVRHDDHIHIQLR
ncbi:hypothetical protein ACX0G7_13195 [Flavitalea antarctica]